MLFVYLIFFLELSSIYSFYYWIKFRKQEQSGSCWAFAVTIADSIQEGKHYKNIKIYFILNKFQLEVNLIEQHLTIKEGASCLLELKLI